MIYSIIKDIIAEREHRLIKYGIQNHPILFEPNNIEVLKSDLEYCKSLNDEEKNEWYIILVEKLLDAFIETDLKIQKEKMVKVCAVVIDIIEYLERKTESNDNK